MASLGGSLNSAATSYASILADVEKLQTLFSDPKVFDYFSNPIVRVEDKAGAEAHWSKNVRIKTQLDPSLVAVRSCGLSWFEFVCEEDLQKHQV